MENNLDIKKMLGERIKECRKKRKLTQGQLAEKIGINERSMSKIECGDSFITADTLTKILTILDIEAKELFNFESKKNISKIKDELCQAIQNETVDVELLYKFYRSIK